MSYKETIDNQIDENSGQQNFIFRDRNLEAAKYFSSILKDLKFNGLVLIDLSAEAIKLIIERLKGNTTIKQLLIIYCKVDDKGVCYLAEVLKDTVIKCLTLYHSSIGDVGVEHLARGLKESQVVTLELNCNQIGDDGLNSLANVWKDGKITNMYLNNNKFTIKSSKIISEIFELAGERYIEMNLFDPIRQINSLKICTGNSKYPHIAIGGYPFFVDDVAEFINKTFGEIILKYDNFMYFIDNNKYFKQLIKLITIRELHVNFFEDQSDIFRDIFEIFQNCPIHKLELNGYPPYFYHKRNPWITRLKRNYVRNMHILVDMLKCNNIRHLSIRMNISLINYLIKPLIYAIKPTLVTHLEFNTKLNAKTANNLANIIGQTQLVSINFDKGLPGKEPLQRYLTSLSKNKKTADLICSAFDNLVALNPRNNKLKFTSPKDSGPLSQYIQFIKILIKNPNSRTHLTEDKSEKEKIEEFVKYIEDHFNTFINNNVESLVEQYGECSFLELVREFDSVNLGHIVQNLLLHRTLFYIDEDWEILNPFIYMMLYKYKLPLYNELLEPNKKSDIMKYFLERPEMKDAEELVELLEHVS